MRLVVNIPDERHMIKDQMRGWCSLVADPFILLGLGANLVQHIGLGVVIATESAWMLEYLHAQQWNIGVVLVVGAVFQFVGQYITGCYSVHMGRWLFCTMSLLMSGAAYFMYPFCQSVWHVIGPEVLARLGLGMFLAVLSPLLSHIVDLRHESNYGAVYGLYAASYNLGLVLGPIAGGVLLREISFEWLYRSTAAITCGFALISIFFKKLDKHERGGWYIDKTNSYGSIGETT